MAFHVRNDRHGERTWTVGVIGDGALTGGLAWEALNNIAASKHRRIVIVVNDNGRSYAPTIGGLADHLDALRTSAGYEKALAWGKQHLLSHGTPGRAAYDALHGLKSGIKDALMPQVMFEAWGSSTSVPSTATTSPPSRRPSGAPAPSKSR